MAVYTKIIKTRRDLANTLFRALECPRKKKHVLGMFINCWTCLCTSPTHLAYSEGKGECCKSRRGCGAAWVKVGGVGEGGWCSQKSADWWLNSNLLPRISFGAVHLGSGYRGKESERRVAWVCDDHHHPLFYPK